MGNYRFKFSDMIPNAWFYKLKDTSKAMRSSNIKKTPARGTAGGSSSLAQAQAMEPSPPPPRCRPGRASYYFPSREEKLPSSPVQLGWPDSGFPNGTSKKKTKKKHQSLFTVAECSGPATDSCNARRTQAFLSFPAAAAGDGDDDGDDYEGVPCSVKPVIAEHGQPHKPPVDGIYGSESTETISRSSSCRFTSSATDIILDMRRENTPGQEIQETGDILGVSELVLPPILTKPVKPGVNGRKPDFQNGLQELDSSSPSRERRKSVRIHGRKMRACSPRLAGKKIRHRKSGGSSARKFLTESFAVVKNSTDPGRDFRNSMMEMIAENNIRASKDLEDLLACYLSLNSNEYHDVIVKVFEQIWFDLTKLRLRDSS